MIKKGGIKSNRKKLLLGNNTSKSGYKKIIDKLVEIQIKTNNKLVIISFDKFHMNLIIKAWLKKKPNFKKSIYVKDNVKIIDEKKIKYVAFNQDLKIPGPITILENIIIIPGDLPTKLHQEEIEKRAAP
jgi:hypothetical protein